MHALHSAASVSYNLTIAGSAVMIKQQTICQQRQGCAIPPDMLSVTFAELCHKQSKAMTAGSGFAVGGGRVGSAPLLLVC